MLTTLKRARAAEALATRLMLEADDREAKFRNFISHATGGRTADTSLSLNTLSVLATSKVNDAFAAGRECGGFDPLPCMSEAERKVLDAMSSEIARPLAQLAADLGLKESEVRAIVQVFVLRGMAVFGHLNSDGGEGTQLHGRGYTLTEPTGLRLRNRLRAPVAA